MNYLEKIKEAKRLINFGGFVKKKYIEAKESGDNKKMEEYLIVLKDTHKLLSELEIYPAKEREINIDEI